MPSSFVRSQITQVRPLCSVIIPTSCFFYYILLLFIMSISNPLKLSTAETKINSLPGASSRKGACLVRLATSYSPRTLRFKYHRRWRA